jgi:hypothetical protein
MKWHLVAQWLEQLPAKAEFVAGNSPASNSRTSKEIEMARLNMLKIPIPWGCANA